MFLLLANRKTMNESSVNEASHSLYLIFFCVCRNNKTQSNKIRFIWMQKKRLRIDIAAHIIANEPIWIQRNTDKTHGARNNAERKKNIAYECSCLLDLVLYLLSWSKSIDVFVGIEIIVVSCTHCDNNNDDGLILTKEKKS